MLGPYKTYYNVCLNDWMLSNPGKPATGYSVTSLENLSAKHLPNKTVKRSSM
jgi:hypothetical protein